MIYRETDELRFGRLMQVGDFIVFIVDGHFMDHNLRYRPPNKSQRKPLIKERDLFNYWEDYICKLPFRIDFMYYIRAGKFYNEFGEIDTIYKDNKVIEMGDRRFNKRILDIVENQLDLMQMKLKLI